MNCDELFRRSFQSIEVNDAFTEAVIHMDDGSRLCFCHKVGERWAKAEGSDPGEDPSLAGKVLNRIAMFRLNGKHLDIQFQDGSRWEMRFRESS